MAKLMNHKYSCECKYVFKASIEKDVCYFSVK